MQEPNKSQSKTFRLGQELVDMLEKAAKRAHMGESAFASGVLEDRLSIDPIIPALPQIRLSSETFQSILSASNADALEMASSEVGQRNFPLAFNVGAPPHHLVVTSANFKLPDSKSMKKSRVYYETPDGVRISAIVDSAEGLNVRGNVILAHGLNNDKDEDGSS